MVKRGERFLSCAELKLFAFKWPNFRLIIPILSLIIKLG